MRRRYSELPPTEEAPWTAGHSFQSTLSKGVSIVPYQVRSGSDSTFPPLIVARRNTFPFSSGLSTQAPLSAEIIAGASLGTPQLLQYMLTRIELSSGSETVPGSGVMPVPRQAVAAADHLAVRIYQLEFDVTRAAADLDRVGGAADVA